MTLVEKLGESQIGKVSLSLELDEEWMDMNRIVMRLKVEGTDISEMVNGTYAPVDIPQNTEYSERIRSWCPEINSLEKKGKYLSRDDQMKLYMETQRMVKRLVEVGVEVSNGDIYLANEQ